MKRKIYISINLPKRTRKSLIQAIEEWDYLPVKWTKEGNLHVSLLFLGFVDDDTCFEICQKIRDLCQKIEIFDIELDHIQLAPSDIDAKKIVLIGKHSEKLRFLVENIEKELDIFKSARKDFKPHIILGKIRKKMWDELPEKPVIDKKHPILVDIESIDIMASDFQSDDGEYVIVENCTLSV